MHALMLHEICAAVEADARIAPAAVPRPVPVMARGADGATLRPPRVVT